MFSAAATEIEITPPVGQTLDGYTARQGASTAIHDPLMAQLLILSYQQKRAAVVSMDTLAVSAVFSDALRQALATELGTDIEAVLICASHTHAGPTGLQTWFPVGMIPTVNRALVQTIQNRLITAAQEALGRLQEVRLVCGQATVTGLGGDRNQPQKPVDSTVTTLRFDHLDGTPTACIFHYACHPTVLGYDNRAYSADFPGAARARLQEAYPDAVCMYLNGAAGNVSPRYFRRDQSFAEVSRLGRLLGDQAISALEHGQDISVDRLAWAAQETALPIRTFPMDETLSPRATGDARIDQTRREGAALETQLQRVFAGRAAQKTVVNALYVGPWTLLGVPGEPFNDLSVAVRQISPFGLVIGYANDYVGYFPTQEAVNSGTYEALSSPYDTRAHHVILNALTDLLNHD